MIYSFVPSLTALVQTPVKWSCHCCVTALCHTIPLKSYCLARPSMEFEKPEIGGHQRMFFFHSVAFQELFHLFMGPPLYQPYILLQNCHCMVASLKVADANNIKILKKSWRAATGIKEAWGEDGLLNQLHILMFPSPIQHTNRDHSQLLPPRGSDGMNMTRGNTEAVCCIRGDASIFALPGN